ncbi:AHH domain-containing protein [Aquimarina aggregata]|uniref:AHH domain-containing protein n=1 Tax=Aquimarina aggregata TaxID=1642818 RepID=UPI002491DF50|nr:AHH domain-containing protein [Aquimarina aggregata]
MATYINKLQASGNTLDEAVEDFKRKLEYVMVPMYPEEFETREIQGQTYMYLNGEWSLQLDEVVITASTITNTRAFIIASSGIRLHKTASPHDTEYVFARSGKNVSATNIATTIYKPGEEILYIGPSQNAKGWAFIQTSDGKQGHIERHHIMILEKNAILDNFTQAYHYVKQEGEGLESIINTYFANYNFKRGKDKRTIAEALIFLNQSSDHDHGLYFKQEEKGIFEKVHSGVIDAHDPWFQKARELYKTVQVPLYTVLRIPTVAYIDYLAKIGKLSQRPDLVNEMINVGEIIVDVAAGIAGVIVGIIEGFVVGIWDALVGLVDLVSSIIDVIKKLVQGTFIEDLKKMYAMMIGLSWEDIKKLGDAISGGLISQIQNFSTLSAFEKGRVIGKIIGMVLLEVVLAFFTGGAANAAKWAGKLGKFAKVAKTIAKVGDDVLGPLNKMNKKLIDKISDKVPKKFKNKNGKGDYDDNEKNRVLKQTILNLVRAKTLALDEVGATLSQLKTDLFFLAKPLPGAKFFFPPEIGMPGTYDVYFKASPKKKVANDFTSGTKGKNIADTKAAGLLNKKINDLKKAPDGYQIVKTKKGKQIKRLDADNPNTPQLTVNDKGEIIEYKGPKNNRISVSGKLRRILGTPDGHQAHHLVADNVVQKSKLHTLARKKDLYDLDRKGNGISLAETVEDFAKDPTGMSSKLPLHKGNHKEWDKLTTGVIEEYERRLIKKFGKLDIPPVTEEAMKLSLEGIEKKLLKEMNGLPSGIKLE